MLLVMVICLSLSSCGKKDASKLISESENMAEAFKQFESLMENAESEEEKAEIESAMNDYLLRDIKGFYYYNRPDMASMHVDSDNRAIYVVSKDEVYIVPYSELELTEMKLRLEDVPQIENSEIYKYHVVEVESGAKSTIGDDSTVYYYSKIVLKSDYVDGDEPDAFNSVKITCYSVRNPMAYDFVGYFADEQNMIPEHDRELGWPAVREYFRDEDASVSRKAERDAQDSGWGEPEEKEPPSIQMTKSEVLNSAWGKPDKKNIDEYAWGTKEQWVYDGKGYIYFENDVVTSIQYR